MPEASPVLCYWELWGHSYVHRVSEFAVCALDKVNIYIIRKNTSYLS